MNRAFLIRLVGSFCLGLVSGSAWAASPPFLLRWGTYGTGPGPFNNPYDVAVNGAGEVYVADTYGARIQKFSATGEFLMQWGSFGTDPGQFGYPSGIALDASGNVYVTDVHTDGAHSRVEKFSASGTYLTAWGSFGTGDGQFGSPSGIAVAHSGDVYVSDIDNQTVQRFTADGTFISRWGSAGTGDGQFDGAASLAIDAGDHVYAMDYNNSRVEEFTADGVFITKWGVPWSITPPDQFSPWPEGYFNGYGIAIDPQGNFCIADTYNNRIQRFSRDGVFLEAWGSYGYGDSRFFNPRLVDVDQNGNIYVADTGNHQIQKFGSATVSVPGLDAAVEGGFAVAPNPGRGRRVFTVAAPVVGPAKIVIYDLSGRRIATPFEGRVELGANTHAWEGRLADGSPLAPGLYLARLSFSGGSRTLRLVNLIK
jgi:DNA-binding beta-propeller fold protein YncE